MTSPGDAVGTGGFGPLIDGQRQMQDESLLPATLRDLDYLERRVRELEEKVERLERW